MICRLMEFLPARKGTERIYDMLQIKEKQSKHMQPLKKVNLPGRVINRQYDGLRNDPESTDGF